MSHRRGLSEKAALFFSPLPMNPDPHFLRLIVADMDGTLLDSAHQLPPDFLDLLKELNEKSIFFAVASGRQFANLRDCFSESFPGMIYIAENGAYVHHANQELLVNTLDYSLVSEVIEYSTRYPVLIPVVCGVEAAYTTCGDKNFIKLLKTYFSRIEVLSELTGIRDRILKVTFYDPKGAENHGCPLFRSFEPTVSVKAGSPIWVDITASGVNKGRAIQKIQEIYRIPFRSTMVFGDYLNDLEMMESGWFSYAMSNAHPEVKIRSRFIAPGNDEYGVMKVLRGIFPLHTSS